MTETDRQTDRQRQRQRHRDRHTERQRQRETETERQRKEEEEEEEGRLVYGSSHIIGNSDVPVYIVYFLHVWAGNDPCT